MGRGSVTLREAAVLSSFNGETEKAADLAWNTETFQAQELTAHCKDRSWCCWRELIAVSQPPMIEVL